MPLMARLHSLQHQSLGSSPYLYCFNPIDITELSDKLLRGPSLRGIS